MTKNNPCLQCGACCAHYRVSFYWSEADSQAGGAALSDWVDYIPPYYMCMKGTNKNEPRCLALKGQIGEKVSCQIYAERPSPCREFGMQWHHGRLYCDPETLQRCNQARASWSLLPLTCFNSRHMSMALAGHFHHHHSLQCHHPHFIHR